LAGVPVFALQLTPGSAQGIPRAPPSVQGLDLLRRAVGPGALSPTQIVVDALRNRRALAPGTQAAIGRLRARLAVDAEVAVVEPAPGVPFVDPSGRYQELIVIGRHEYGQQQ